METFKSHVGEKVTYPHVHLSFDDHAIGSIYSMRGFFLKYRVKAVFYVDSFDTLDEDDLEYLAALRADGHVIGCHGLNHIDALEYSKRYGIEAYIDEEVLPAMEAMASQGFSPTHFAFPYSSFDEQLYDAVSELFCYVRPGNESHYYTPSRMYFEPDRFTGSELSIEHKVRSGDLVGAIRGITERLKAGYGISIVIHDIRPSDGRKSEGSRASTNAYLTPEEFVTILEAIRGVGNVQYQTFADVCKQGKDSFDKPSALP
jgi:hypothetical protein